jgi:leucyl-tRNA---protein transferase
VVRVDAGPCPYLPGRRFTALQTPAPPEHYRALMDLRFRRSGAIAYAPDCEGCSACQPIRIPVDHFRPRADQRRCAARNRDLVVSWATRGLDDERRALYERYQHAVHGVSPGDDPAAFLVADGGVPGGELHARDAAGRLLAVSIIDCIGDACSSVYCYYDPDERRRSLGTWMALAELAWCRERGLRWWYLGFAVSGCAAMAYKERFVPQERLTEAGWEPQILT